MRFVLVAVCALALAFFASATPFRASAAPINWKVDTQAYQPRTFPHRADQFTTTYDFGSMDVGRFRLAPSFAVRDAPSGFTFTDPAPFSKSVDVELGAYLKDHPRVGFVVGYLYRQARHKEQERQAALEHANHLPAPDIEHGRVRVGITCKFPLLDCFKRFAQ